MKKILPIIIFTAVITSVSCVAVRTMANEPIKFEDLSDYAVERTIAHAKAVLRAIAQAAEVYALENGGLYPTSERDMLDSQPPTLNISACGKEEDFYFFECAFTRTGYFATAKPAVEANLPSFKITTGQVLSEI